MDERYRAISMFASDRRAVLGRTGFVGEFLTNVLAFCILVQKETRDYWSVKLIDYLKSNTGVDNGTIKGLAEKMLEVLSS